MTTLGTVVFGIVCGVVIAFGALQCFAPQALRRLQKELRPKADWSASAGGKFFEDLADRQANNASLLHRLAGLMVMATGLYMLSIAVASLLSLMRSMPTVFLLVWELFCFVVVVACSVAGFFLARMLKRRSHHQVN